VRRNCNKTVKSGGSTQEQLRGGDLRCLAPPILNLIPPKNCILIEVLNPLLII